MGLDNRIAGGLEVVSISFPAVEQVIKEKRWKVAFTDDRYAGLVHLHDRKRALRDLDALGITKKVEDPMSVTEDSSLILIDKFGLPAYVHRADNR